MREFIMANEPAIRLSVFLGIFALVAIAEALAPRRRRSLSRLARWPNNIGVVVVNTLVVPATPRSSRRARATGTRPAHWRPARDRGGG